MKAAPIPAHDEARLRALRRLGVLDTPAEEVFDQLTAIAAHVFGAPIALVTLVDTGRQWFKSRHGLDLTEGTRDVSFCGHVVAEEQMLVVADAHVDARFSDNPLVHGHPHVRFYAGAPLRSTDGYVVGSFCVIDHEPRRATPEQLFLLEALARHVEHVLEMRREMQAADPYRRLFETSNAMPCVAGFDGFFKTINVTWSDVLGYTQEELLTTPFIDFVHPDDVARTVDGATRLALGGEVVFFRNRYRCRDGTYRWLEWNAASDQNAELIYAVAADITERVRIERMKDEFVSVVSHELRTPLTSVRGSLRLLQVGAAGPLPDEAQELVGVATSNCERLIRLINDMLDLDRIESGKADLQLVPISLGALLQRALDEIGGMAKDARVTLALHAPAEVTVAADADRLMQLAQNLISNSIKYSPPDGEVRVAVRRMPDGIARVEFTDTGPGISDANQRRLFQKFELLDAADNRKRPGTGLGLAISKAIVDQHRGRIGVASELGHGSTFWFELPPVGAPKLTSIPPGPMSSRGPASLRAAHTKGKS